MKKFYVLLLLCLILGISGCSSDTGTDETAEKDTVQNEAEDTDSQVDTYDILDNSGEGSPSMQIADLTNSSSYALGEAISIDSQYAKYELTINSAECTELQDEYEDQMTKVLLIDYAYTNLGDEDLLIDSVCFQLTNADGDVYEPYYFTSRVIAEPAGSGETSNGQIAFAIDESAGEFDLIYTDLFDSESEPIIIKLENMNE